MAEAVLQQGLVISTLFSGQGALRADREAKVAALIYLLVLAEPVAPLAVAATSR